MVSLQLLLVSGLCWVIDIASPYAFQRERPNFKRRHDSKIARPSLESTKEARVRVRGYGQDGGICQYNFIGTDIIATEAMANEVTRATYD